MFEMSWDINCDGRKGDAAINHVIHGINGFQLEVKQKTIEELGVLIYETYRDILARFPISKSSHSDEGHAIDHIHFEDFGGGHFEIWIDDLRILWLEYGTQGHGPKTAPLLVFKADDGKIVRTKWVKGIKAHYIINLALNRLRQQVRAM